MKEPTYNTSEMFGINQYQTNAKQPEVLEDKMKENQKREN